MQQSVNVANLEPAWTIADVLAPRLVHELGSLTVAESVRRAVEDLRSSVSPEALPEMAARLALHRLTSRPVAS